MADTKISALTASTTPLAGTEVLPIVQSSTTKQVSVANLTAGRAVSALSATLSSLTSGRVPYATTSGLLTDSANLQFSGSNLLLGTTSQLQSSVLSVLGSGNIGDFRTTSSGGYPVICENTAAGSTSMVIFLSGPSTTTVGSITYNGAVTVYGTTSDARLKENIADASSSLDFVNTLKVRSFDWIESEKHQDFGFIAQELYEVSPDCVYKPQDEDSIWQIDTSVLIPALVKSIQEQQTMIDALKARLDAANL